MSLFNPAEVVLGRYQPYVARLLEEVGAVSQMRHWTSIKGQEENIKKIELNPEHNGCRTITLVDNRDFGHYSFVEKPHYGQAERLVKEIKTRINHRGKE